MGHSIELTQYAEVSLSQPQKESAIDSNATPPENTRTAIDRLNSQEPRVCTHQTGSRLFILACYFLLRPTRFSAILFPPQLFRLGPSRKPRQNANATDAQVAVPRRPNTPQRSTDNPPLLALHFPKKNCTATYPTLKPHLCCVLLLEFPPTALRNARNISMAPPLMPLPPIDAICRKSCAMPDIPPPAAPTKLARLRGFAAEALSALAAMQRLCISVCFSCFFRSDGYWSGRAG